MVEEAFCVEIWGRHVCGREGVERKWGYRTRKVVDLKKAGCRVKEINWVL